MGGCRFVVIEVSACHLCHRSRTFARRSEINRYYEGRPCNRSMVHLLYS